MAAIGSLITGADKVAAGINKLKERKYPFPSVKEIVPGYRVTPDGKVFSVRSNRFIYLDENRHGYHRVRLTKGKRFWVHRLVAAAFIGDVSGLSVHHVNGVRNDNRVENLRIMTQAENLALRGTTEYCPF